MNELHTFPADAEESVFRSYVRAPASKQISLHDVLFSRCADAIEQLAVGGEASTLDLAVLIRQVLRRASERDGVPFRLVLPTTLVPDHEWERVGVSAAPTADGGVMLEASAWKPTWIPDAVEKPVDGAAAAGTERGKRARFDFFPADPFFENATGYASYRTAGQRAAVRAAVSMPRAGTLIAVLPTGSGKTEVAVTLAHLARKQTTIIVVPTVALAYDFERRFREFFARRNPRLVAEDLPFAWTSDTDSQTREKLKQLLTTGKLPLLVTSPESLTGALLHAVRGAATAGRLRALVIDEAHLVTQWGRDFRPEFRQLANLRRELLDRNLQGSHEGFSTLLLSATLGRTELEDLVDMFSWPGPISLVAANALRAEPEYWIAARTDPTQRGQRVLEAALHLPRPLLLYVTSPDEAERWERELRIHGFGRMATVTGRTAGKDRRDVLEGIRAGAETRSLYDLVIATSAFGLGIDNDQFRGVIHACLPETIDRWYQEVSRAGRDGHQSVALLIPADGDEDEAASLGIKLLTPGIAFKRWRSLWAGRVPKNGANYIDVQGAPRGSQAGSYNRRWNAQVLRGLEELGQISREALSLDEAAALELPFGTEVVTHEWERIVLRHVELHEEEFFATTWEPWRQVLMRQSYSALAKMKGALKPEAPVCHLIAKAHSPGSHVEKLFGIAADFVEPASGCGRCPGCRATQVSPVVDPPPRIPNVWAVEEFPNDALENLMSACPTGNRLSVLVADDPSEIAGALAISMIQAGIRLVAGTTVPASSTHVSWWCTDEADMSPHDLPPLPAFVVPPSDRPVDQAWLLPRQPRSDGTPAPLILLVSSKSTIGTAQTPVKRLPVLRATVALNILGRGA